MANEIKIVKNILYNHQKLLSMISDKLLPIKHTLLHDVYVMRGLLEKASTKKEVDAENKEGGKK